MADKKEKNALKSRQRRRNRMARKTSSKQEGEKLKAGMTKVYDTGSKQNKGKGMFSKKKSTTKKYGVGGLEPDVSGYVPNAERRDPENVEWGVNVGKKEKDRKNYKDVSDQEYEKMKEAGSAQGRNYKSPDAKIKDKGPLVQTGSSKSKKPKGSRESIKDAEKLSGEVGLRKKASDWKSKNKSSGKFFKKKNVDRDRVQAKGKLKITKFGEDRTKRKVTYGEDRDDKGKTLYKKVDKGSKVKYKKKRVSYGKRSKKAYRDL